MRDSGGDDDEGNAESRSRLGNRLAKILMWLRFDQKREGHSKIPLVKATTKVDKLQTEEGR